MSSCEATLLCPLQGTSLVLFIFLSFTMFRVCEAPNKCLWTTDDLPGRRAHSFGITCPLSVPPVASLRVGALVGSCGVADVTWVVNPSRLTSFSQFTRHPQLGRHQSREGALDIEPYLGSL